MYGGSWRETIGSAVFFEETEPVPKRCYFSEKVQKPLKYFAKTQKALHMKRIFISEKESSVSKVEEQITEVTSDVKLKTEVHLNDEDISMSV